MQKRTYRSSIGHWMCYKWRPDWNTTPPEGMSWFVVEPWKGLHEGAHWFPTGKQAIEFLMAMNPANNAIKS